MTRAKMSDAKLADLPEDILEGIFCLVAEDCFKGDDGFKQWCQLAAELPRLSTLLLPRAPLKQLTRRDLPWEGVKWALLRQPSASLLHIAVQKRGREIGILGTRRVHTWRGLTQQGQEEGEDEVEAMMEVSEDKRGCRSLVLRFFPRYDDDADNFSGHHTSQQLRPWVNKLLQLGIADLRGLRLNGDIIACPTVLGRLPLRHLELDIGGSSMAHLEEIMAALDQCTTLEYLSIAHLETCKLGFTSVVELPDLCLCKAPNLKHVYLQDSVPRKRLCLPPECKVRLNLHGHFESWEYIMQKKHGRILRACISVMHLKLACCYKGSWLSHLQDFKALQSLGLVSPQMLLDLAQLDGIPHVRLEVGIMLDIDSFVGSNHKYLFISHKATKAWRGMRDSLDAARKRQGVSFFKHDRTDGSYEPAKLSSIPEMVSSKDAHLVCVKELWPEECMWSRLHPAASELRGGQLYYSSSSDLETGSGSDSDPEAEAESKTESDSDSDSETDPESEIGSESGASLGSQASVDLSYYCTALSEVDREHHAKRLPFWGCLTWHDATSTIDGAQYDGNPQLQRLYEVCSFICHGSREDYMTWSDV